MKVINNKKIFRFLPFDSCLSPFDFLNIFLLYGLLTVPILAEAFPPIPIRQSTQEASSSKTEKEVIEPGRSIKREVAGGQQHTYQITLNADQFLKAVVEQDGIDVVVRLSGPDGKQIIEFDYEIRTHGQEAVTLVAKEAGSYQIDVVATQNNAAAGRYEIQVVELRLATDDDRALHEARMLGSESFKLYLAGKYDEAFASVERVLAIRKRVLGPEHPDIARALNGLAILYANKGDHAKAEPLYKQALAIRERILEPEHPDVAASLNNLANLYYIEGDYAKAEPLYQRSLAIREKALRPDHPNIATAINNLAMLYSDRGEYAKAEPFYQRALAIWQKALGPKHPDVALALNNLAKLYCDRGDYAKAEPFYQRAMAIREKALGPEHPDFADSLNTFANFYIDRGEYAKAEQFYQRALAIWRKALGPEHSNVAGALNNLANLYRYRGDYAKAEPLYQQALTVQEKALGPDSYHTVQPLDNLAQIYRATGNHAKAEPFFQRALAIREKSLGHHHDYVALTLNELAMLYTVKGDIAQAITYLSRANAIDERNFALNLATGSERQKLAYLAKFSKRTDFTLSLHSQAAPNNPQALDLAFTTLLRRKARGLDAMADTIATLRRHAAPQDRALLDQLTQARSELAALNFKESAAINFDNEKARLNQLEEQIEKLEGELSERSAEFRAQTQPVILAAVQAALPPASALVEFVIYNPQDPRTGNDQPPRYLAYLLAPQGQPRWVELGEAAPIDRAVDGWRQALRGNRVDAKRLARELDEKIMRPIRSAIQSGQSEQSWPGDIGHLLIAPDGSLNLIPFAALVDEENRYLIERYTISYLTSGRDLLRLQDSPPSENAPLVVADPLFGTVASATVRGAQMSRSSRAGHRTGQSGQPGRRNDPAQKGQSGQIVFRPLPGTKAEALAIKAVLPEASLLLQQEATEAALKLARAPRILHIATHGFFLSDQPAQPAEVSDLSDENPLVSDLRLSRRAARIEEPLLRSGLALSGANRNKNGDDDGVLTALEVAGLDLLGTRLVVLSACDTGVGEVKNGEGVQGLRRALILAGSESQVMSLWPVTDEGAKELMIDYYRSLQRAEGRSEGLRQVQLRMLRSEKWRHPFYWAAFIQSGEWANLEGRR